MRVQSIAISFQKGMAGEKKGGMPKRKVSHYWTDRIISILMTNGGCEGVQTLGRHTEDPERENG